MLTIPSMLPLPYKIGAAVLVVGLFAWKMYNAGANSVQKEWNAQKVVDLAAVHIVKDRSQAVSEAVDKKHNAENEKIKTVYRTITKEVKVYVTKNADSACTITNGFVRNHDAAASCTIPEAPSSVNDSPSGVEVSTVAETVAENYGTYAEIRQRLIDLQEWVKKQGDVKP